MPDRSLRLTTTMGRVVDLVIMPPVSGNTPFRWRSGAYDVDIAYSDAKRLLEFLDANYNPQPRAQPTQSRAPRLVVRIEVCGELGRGGRGIAEVTKLLGLALGRLADGELDGEVTDAHGLRGVRWRSG